MSVASSADSPRHRQETKPHRADSPQSPVFTIHTPEALTPERLPSTPVQLHNWSIVWAKQQGWPWWPARLVLVDALEPAARAPLEKFLERRYPGQELVRFFADGYSFGWVDREKICPFRDKFGECISERMLEDDVVVDAITRALDASPDPKAELATMLDQAVQLKKDLATDDAATGDDTRAVSLGVLVVRTPLTPLLHFSVTVSRATPTDADPWRELHSWREADPARLNTLLNEILRRPLLVDVLLDPRNRVGETLADIRTGTTNIETAALADILETRAKAAVRTAYETGEYRRCKDLIQ